MTFSSRLPSLLALALITACDDATAPPLQLGTYTLVSISGRPAPFVLWDTTWSTGAYMETGIAADTFQVESSNRLVRARRDFAVFTGVSGGLDTAFSYISITATYRRTAGGLIVIYDTIGAPPPWDPADTLYLEQDGRLRLDALVSGWCQGATCPTPHLEHFYYQR